MKSTPYIIAPLFCSLLLPLPVLAANDFPDQDHDGYHDAIELRYGSQSFVSNAELTPTHGAPIIIGTVQGWNLVPEQRFPEIENAVAIDAGGNGEQQYVLILKGDGSVAVWSAGADSVEELLFEDDWSGTHPRHWKNIVSIEVAPFGLFGIDADGVIHACGETWAVFGVDHLGVTEMIETSYDSLIVLSDDGSIFTLVHGWEDDSYATVPAETTDVESVAAGLNTFWAVNSQGAIRRWGDPTALSSMDVSSLPSDDVESVTVSPLAYAGVAIVGHQNYTFGSASDSYGNGAPSVGAVQTPGQYNSFSFLYFSFQSPASLSPPAPQNWLYLDIASSESAAYGILRDASALEYAVADEIGVFPISMDSNDWENLTYLDLSDLPILSLDGLERARNLVQLSLEKTGVTDLSPLASLEKLRELSIIETPVLDLEPIASQWLDLAYFDSTPLTEIVFGDGRSAWDFDQRRSAAEFAGRHDDVQFRQNSSSPEWWQSIDPVLVEWIRIETGYADHIELREINLMSAALLSMEGLDEVSSLRGIGQLVGLEGLDLSDQAVVDLSPLADLASLETLNLSNNPVADLSPLLALTHLRELNISDTGAAEILADGDSEMGMQIALEAILQELEQRGVSVINYRALLRDDWQLHFDAATLEVIEPTVGDTSDLSYADLQLLTVFNADLRISGIPSLQNLNGLQYCGNLQQVKLIEQVIDDLTPLKYLSHLSQLWVIHYETQEVDAIGQTNDGRLSDLSPLAGHPALEGVWLMGTNILDIEPILDLPMLQELELNDTFWAELVTFGNEESPAVQAAQRTHLELEASGVHVYSSVSAGDRRDWWRAFEPALGTALRFDIGGDFNADLSLNDLESKTSLNLVGYGIRDLRGIDVAYKVEDLDLSGNAISDIGPLVSLSQLSILNLNDNPLAVADALLELNALNVVSLGDTFWAELVHQPSDSDYSVLSRSTDLSSALDARGVSVSFDSYDSRDDWWRLMSSELSAMLLDQMERSSYSLSLLDLSGRTSFIAENTELCPIANASGIEYLYKLTDINLSDQLISDLTPLSLFYNLQHLDLSNTELDQWPRNAVSDLSPLSGVENLQELSLQNTDVLNLEPLLSLTELSAPSLDGTFAADLLTTGNPDNPYRQQAQAVVDRLGAASTAGAGRSDYWRVFEPALGAALMDELGNSDLLTLSDLESATQFSASERGIRSLENIGLAYRLETVNLDSNLIGDLTPLAELTFLKYLNLRDLGSANGEIVDLTPLVQLPSLKLLNLESSPLLDIEVLLSMSQLDEVTLSGTFVGDGTDAELPMTWVVGALRNRGLTVVTSASRDGWELLLDPALANAWVDEIEGSLSFAALSTQEELNFPESGITTLDGLQYATGLKRLYLGDNYITDLSPLAELTGLTNLDLSVSHVSDGNLFKDLAPLSNLWALTDLNLNGCAATDFSVLLRLPSLQSVDLENTIIQSGDSLLEELAARGISCSIGGDPDYTRILAPSLLQALESHGGVHLNVESLDLDGMNITSIEGIGIFRELEYLTLNENGISDISPLQGLPALREFSIDNNYYYYGGNQVSDISVLTSLPKLENFSATGNWISDIRPLLECAQLQYLSLDDNFIINDYNGDDPESPDAVILQELSDRGVQIYAYSSDRTDWWRLFNDPWLLALIQGSSSELTQSDLNRQLYLKSSDPIADLSGLEKYYTLQKLDLDQSYVQDLSPLADLPDLQTLILSRDAGAEGQLLEDLSPLSEISTLESLDLSHQGITDLTPLMGLPNLQELNVSGNYLNLDPDSSTGQQLQALRDQGVDVVDDSQRDIWNHFSDVGLAYAVKESLGLSMDAVLSESDWQDLSTLSAAGMGIQDVSMLELAQQLQNVDLAGNQITDLDALAGMTDLRSLDLTNSEQYIGMENSLSDLSPLAGLTDLETLELAGNSISDLSPLLSLRNLSGLNLDANLLDLRSSSDTLRLIEALIARGTEVTYDDRYRAGLQEVQDNPESFSLFTETQLRGLALGKPTLEQVDGQFQLQLDVYESVDLIEWLPGQGSFTEQDGQLIWEPSNPGNTRFYSIEAQ
jgi:internalin A